jgi:protein SCO1/2
MANRKLIFYAIFFFALSGLFLFFVFVGTDNWKSKPPVLGYVREFSFVNTEGEKVDNRVMAGKVCVVNFFFTNCKGVCPRMNGRMMEIYQGFKNEPDLLLISHTCDPERDSVTQLKKYADGMGIDKKRWIFLTGRKDSLYQAARVSYLLDDPNNKVNDLTDDFLHTQFIALVDKQGKVRSQIFDALKAEDMSLLKVNIQKLLKESGEGNKFSGGMFSNNPQ